MKCPMRKVRYQSHTVAEKGKPETKTYVPGGEGFGECIGKECAWWVKDAEACAIAVQQVIPIPNY